jgi:hypothetical protein
MSKIALFRPKNRDLIRPFKKNAKTTKNQKNCKFSKPILQTKYSDYRHVAHHFEVDDELLSNDPFMGAQHQDLDEIPMNFDSDYVLNEHNNIIIEMEIDLADLFLDDNFLGGLDLNLLLDMMDDNLTQIAPAG